MTAIPDGTRRLADGLVIEGSIVARVLGLRLLNVQAALVVSPAEMRAAPSPRPVGAGLAAAVRCIEDGAASLAVAESRSVGAGLPDQVPRGGARLVDHELAVAEEGERGGSLREEGKPHG